MTHETLSKFVLSKPSVNPTRLPYIYLPRRITPHLAFSRGARSVLYAFHCQEGLTTVFSQFKGAEQDALGAVI